LDEGKLQGTKYASIYPSFWIVIYQEYLNSHIKLRWSSIVHAVAYRRVSFSCTNVTLKC